MLTISNLILSLRRKCKKFKLLAIFQIPKLLLPDKQEKRLTKHFSRFLESKIKFTVGLMLDKTLINSEIWLLLVMDSQHLLNIRMVKWQYLSSGTLDANSQIHIWKIFRSYQMTKRRENGATRYVLSLWA